MDIKRKTIFLVDDGAVNLTVGKAALVQHYKILTLNSGRLLLKTLERIIPDLVLLDIEMPEMDGYETIKILKSRKETKNIPVIFLTAKDDGDSELKGLSLGAIDYITKPFSIPLLLKRIEVHLLVEFQKRELINFNNNLQEIVEAKTKTVVTLKNAVLKTMAELVEFRDNTTGGHIERTQKYLGILLGELMMQGLYAKESRSWDLMLVLQSSQLHDIGKIAVKDAILQKPGKLTKDEFEEIKTHTVVGEEIIEKIKRNTTEQVFLEYAKILAASHHEKWDGSGYPKGLKGEEIPLLGRIMAIADVYDAVVNERPYKKAFSHEEAVKIISERRGTHFDPLLVDLFLNVSDKFKKIALPC